MNEKNNDGNTPFLLACCNGHKEIVELLLTCRDIIVPDDIKTENEKIKELIERYKKNPETVRLNLILKGNINLYRHIVFMCDGYYKLNENTENNRATRFMKIASVLPLELQMTLIHRLSGSSRTIITSKQFDENIAKYIDTLNKSELEEQYYGQYQEFETKYGPMIVIDEAHDTLNKSELEEQYYGQYQEFETKYGPMIVIDEAHDTLNKSELEEQYYGQYQEFETKYGPMIVIDEAHYTENNIDLEFLKYMLNCGTS